MRLFIIGPVAALSLIGCTADTSSDSGAGDAAVQVNSDYLEMDGVDSSMCGEDYSVCGDLLISDNFTGTPRSLAVALYTSIPPAGPPAGIVAEIDGPDIVAGYRYPIRELPVLFTGEFYVWINLYMEGGGEWLPINDVDYTGSTPEPLIFDGTPIELDDILLELASGW